MTQEERELIWARWDNQTSFYSRLSKHFPTYSFAEHNQLMKDRSAATNAAHFIREALK